MKKVQAVKFWKESSNSTSAKEVISAFANKRGYGGKRTLVRYSQAAAGFKEGLPCNVIAGKTGWSADYIDKIHAWWKEAFSSEVGPITLELATRVAPARTEHELPKEARTEQESCKDSPHKLKMRELAGELRNEINLLGILGSFIVDWKPHRVSYADSRGNRLYPTIIIAENGEISVELRIEVNREIGHLYQGLRCHLETGGFSEVLRETDDWKKGMGQYLQKCHHFLMIALGEIKGQAIIPEGQVDNHERTGYRVSFFKAACADAIEIAKGNPPITDSGYWHEALSNNLWLLIRYDGDGIYVGQTNEELETYEAMHRDLARKLSKSDHAKEIAEAHKNLHQTGDHIKQQLQKFIDMERVPGYCELCCH